MNYAGHVPRPDYKSLARRTNKQKQELAAYRHTNRQSMPTPRRVYHCFFGDVLPVAGSKILSLTLCKAVRNASVQHIFHATIAPTCLAMRMFLHRASQMRNTKMHCMYGYPIIRKRPLAFATTWKRCEHSEQLYNKKVRETEVSRTIADFQAPLWEATNVNYIPFYNIDTLKMPYKNFNFLFQNLSRQIR